jgi:hypothetical protein
LVVVYPSMIHFTRPPTTTGYGSPSGVSHGATLATRVSGSRSKRILDSEFTSELRTMLGSCIRAANSSLLTMLPTGTPPVPVYVLVVREE